jgi:hypothetical protein
MRLRSARPSLKSWGSLLIFRVGRFLPHYRYNRFITQTPSGGIVRMCCVSSRINVRWVSEYRIDTANRQLHFLHRQINPERHTRDESYLGFPGTAGRLRPRHHQRPARTVVDNHRTDPYRLGRRAIFYSRCRWKDSRRMEKESRSAGIFGRDSALSNNRFSGRSNLSILRLTRRAKKPKHCASALLLWVRGHARAQMVTIENGRRCLWPPNRSTYQTRIDAVTFCHLLCRPGPPADFGRALGAFASRGLGWDAG